MRRLLIFGIGSTVGAIIDFCLGLFLLRAGFDGWAALALPMFVSASVVYVIHQKITFADLGSRDLHEGRFTMFLINTVLVYLLRLAVYEILYRAVASHPLALGAALVSSLLVNFGISRLLIFSSQRSN